MITMALILLFPLLLFFSVSIVGFLGEVVAIFAVDVAPPAFADFIFELIFVNHL